MRIIPVIDLMGGVVVRGIAGRRHEYRPIESVLTDNPTPVSVGRALVELGLTQAYVADLDAIQGGEPNFATYRELSAVGLQLWIDAGLGDLARARQLSNAALPGAQPPTIIAGLESLEHPELLSAVLDEVGPQRFIFSLDLKAGEPIVRVPEWQGWSARQIAARAVDLGVRRMIVLDLVQVGMGQGLATLDLCRGLHHDYPQLEITAGGGVRGADDLAAMEQAGCKGALVASALHDGRLKPLWAHGGEGSF